MANEAVSAIAAKPMRSAITTLGTVLGVGTLVAVLGLTSTIQGQISSRFDALAATTVTVEDNRTNSTYQDFPFTTRSIESVKRLNGVEQAGYSWRVPSADMTVSSVFNETSSLGVYAVSPGVWDINKPHVFEGRIFDQFHEDTAADVVVLGAAAAAQLGVEHLDTQPAILIDNRPYVVIGIVDTMSLQPDMLLGVMLPSSTVTERWGLPNEKAQAKMTVQTALGAAGQVANEASLAISPANVDAVKSVPPPNPKSLRDGVSGDLAGLFLALAALCLLVGTVGIANTTLVAVLERTGEIGLRRAVGARRRHIGSQIIAESAALGIIGGIVGSSLGVLVIIIVASVQGWGPVLDPWLVVIAPILGTLSGVLAGFYPAWRATRIEPSEALRR